MGFPAMIAASDYAVTNHTPQSLSFNGLTPLKYPLRTSPPDFPALDYQPDLGADG
jgi:hypothetical protein